MNKKKTKKNIYCKLFKYEKKKGKRERAEKKILFRRCKRYVNKANKTKQQQKKRTNK